MLARNNCPTSFRSTFSAENVCYYDSVLVLFASVCGCNAFLHDTLLEAYLQGKSEKLRKVLFFVHCKSQEIVEICGLLRKGIFTRMMMFFAYYSFSSLYEDSHKHLLIRNQKEENRMKRKYSLISLIFIIAGYLVMFVVHTLHAQLADSAWPMFKHDARHTGQSPYAGPGDNSLKWKYELPGQVIKESPAIGPDGTIYISLGNSFFAINSNGSFKWRYDDHCMGGITPAISLDGTIYIPWSNGLVAVNPNGSQKWKYDASSFSCNNASSPTIGIDGIIYFGLGVDLFAVRPDGNLLWKYRVGEEVNSSPAIGDDGTIYIRGREDYLIALNPDGTERWELNLGTTYSQNIMSPIIGPDGTIYTFGLMNAKHPSLPDKQTAGLHAINPDGTTKWVSGDIEFDAGTIGMTPAIDENGTIYLSGRVLNVRASHVFCAINQSGVLQWIFEPPPSNYFGASSPAIDANGFIYLGTSGNHMYALNPNGTLEWKFETRNIIYSSPAIGKNGMIYFGSSDGNLYAIGGKTTVPQPSINHPIMVPLSILLLSE